MKRFFSIIGILLLFAVFAFIGYKLVADSKIQTKDANTSASIYYINESGSDLVAEKIKLHKATRKGQLEYLIQKLITPPKGKVSPLHENTKVNSITIKDDVAYVDFSDAFYQVDSLKQTLAPAAVAKTLCTLDYISGVQILVNGQEALGADQKPLGIIWEGDLVINKGEASQTPKTTLVLYFGDEQAEYLVTERRNVEISNGNTVEKAVVEELLKGPTEMGHMKTIPQDTKILSIETKNNVCFVNLSKDFVDKHSGGVSAEQLTVYSIVNSLTELGTVDMVQFLIEGEKREDFIHIAFNEPIMRNKSIIRE